MKILFFAWLREKTGVGNEVVDLPAGISDVAGLIDWLKGRGPGFAEAFADGALVHVAVNQEHVDTSHAVKDSDEIAFFPPVTGG